MRTLFLSCVLVLGACASQQASQPSPTGTAAGPNATALLDWDAKVNDAAGAAAILAEAKNFEGPHAHPPQIAAAPSEKTFSNVLVLHQMTSKRFIGAMHGMATALGARCTECHVEEKFASDDKPEKRTARKMLIMSQRLNATFFRGHVALSCYTCHRGSEHPESAPADLEAKLAAMTLPPSLPAIPPGAKRASDVYRNLKLLGGLPPNLLVPVMQQVSLSLGVGCDECHVAGDWASDDKRRKEVARDMLAMVESANAELFGQMHDKDAVTCWTCHRGAKHPERRPTAAP
jgi:hypothetical protein